jgi:hypothetical protein
VDARYLEVQVPATHVPSFTVDDGASVVPVGELTADWERYVVLGAGKTALDAALWLLGSGVAADRIRWVRPRDAWLFDRAWWQPLDQVASIVRGVATELEVLSQEGSTADVLLALEAAGRLVRIDETVPPTMFHCASVSRHELEQLRRIRDVVRLGRVRRIGRDALELEHGTVATDAGTLHVDCTAVGLRIAPPVPVFAPDRITLQNVQYCSPLFSAALIGYVEATRDDLADQNRLCPPNPAPDTPDDWARTVATGTLAAAQWRREPDFAGWLDSCRLNVTAGLRSRADDPDLGAALARVGAAGRSGTERLLALMAR